MVVHILSWANAKRHQAQGYPKMMGRYLMRRAFTWPDLKARNETVFPDKTPFLTRKKPDFSTDLEC
jgi:hypothetical protein